MFSSTLANSWFSSSEVYVHFRNDPASQSAYSLNCRDYDKGGHSKRLEAIIWTYRPHERAEQVMLDGRLPWHLTCPDRSLPYRGAVPS
jgi:hypothetical protein